jgi:hypothetical protein
MTTSTGILDPEVGNTSVPSFDSVLSWSAELDFPELESLIRAIERITQDAGDAEATTRVLLKFRNLRGLADLAGRDKVVLSSVEALTFHILVLLSHFRPDKFRLTFVDALRAIREPDASSMTAEGARNWFIESAAGYLYDTRYITTIREMVEQEADGVTLSAEIRRLVPVSAGKRRDPNHASWRDDSDRLKVMDTALHVWQLGLRFDRDPMPVGTAGGVLWALGEALESVDGVVANVDGLSSGSVWANVRLYVTSIWRLDDIIQIMERTFDKVTDRLSPVAPVQTESPADIQEHVPVVSAELSELEKQALELELEKKRLEVAILKLQHFEKISDLLADRVLEVDSVEFNFNNYPIFVVQERQVVHRAPMNKLRDAEIEAPSSGQGGADVQV